MNNEKVLEQDFQEIEKEIEAENKIQEARESGKLKFEPLSVEELTTILSLTIKEDNINKVITFLGCLSAYTEDCQYNISFNAPSSSGKSYIPTEIALLFPKEDVVANGYCSPTAFFHDIGNYIKEEKKYFVDLERKILVFIDLPHALLLQHLRPLLSHDSKEINMKITDKNLKTKNIVMKGYPAVVFCTAGLRVDEQECTRFLLLSPETSSYKIQQGVREAIKKSTDSEKYKNELENNPQRKLLIERIRAVKEAKIVDIKIHNPAKIEEWFFHKHKIPMPRHQRDIKRLISIIKSLALLNLWYRETEDSGVILTNNEDMEEGFKIWEEISFSQELNLPPYVYRVFVEIIIPTYEQKQQSALTRGEILQGYLKIYGRPLADWQLSREILPALESAGLITQEKDPEDKRSKLITPIYSTGQSILSDAESNVN